MSNKTPSPTELQIPATVTTLDEINHVVDDGIMTSFITINSTTASPKTAELLPPAAALQRTVSMHYGSQI